MAPGFRLARSAGATVGGDPSVSASGISDNDIILAVGSAFGQSIAAPAGFNTLYLEPATQDFGIWWKRASGEAGSYVFTTSGGSNPRPSTVSIAVYSGIATDLAPTIGTVTKRTATSSLGRSVTPDAQAAVLVMLSGCAAANNDFVTSTPPTGMKERAENETRDGASQCQAAIADTSAIPYVTTGDKTSSLFFVSARTTWGALVVLYQTALDQGVSDGKPREMLVELTHYDEGAATEVVKKYSGRGVTFSGGEFYERRLLSGVEIRQHAADRAAVGGIVATTIGDILLDNRDRALDEIYRRGLAVGRTVVVKSVKVQNETASDLGVGAASNAVTIYTGTVAAFSPDGLNMVLTMSDLGERLNVPLQIDTFDGTSGLGGGAELEGQTKPLLFGRAYNLLPQELGNFSLGDGSLYTYMLSSRAINAVDTVYERGVAMTPVGVAPIAGQFRAWLSSGVFQLGFTPNGIITCTGKGDDPAADIYANQHGEILTRMLTQFGPQLATTDLESSTFDAVDAILPGQIGIYFRTGDRSSTRDAVERVLRSGGIWLSGGRNGKLRLSMAMPFPSERLRLREPDIISLKPIALPTSLQPAPHTIEVETERNYNPLTDISSSVTGSTRAKLAGPGRTVKSTSTTLQARQKTPRTWSIAGLWYNDADGRTRADQMRAWVETGLVAFEVWTDHYVGVVELGMGCEIDPYSRYVPNGFSGIVAGYRERPAEGRVGLVLIGSVPEANEELREDGAIELREDGSSELRE